MQTGTGLHRSSRRPRPVALLTVVTAVLSSSLTPFTALGSPAPAGAAEVQAPAPARYHVTDLGELGARDAFAVNDRGDVVGNLDTGHPYRREPLEDPLAVGTVTDLFAGGASALSDDGTVFGDGRGADVGGTARAVTPDGATAAGSSFHPGVISPAYGSGTAVPAVWTRAGGWNSLYDDGCQVPGLKGGTALGINSGGTLVGQGLVGGADFPAGTIRAVALKCIPDPAHPGSYSAYDLAPTGDAVAGAFAVNARGHVAGMAQPFGGGPIEAHRWKGEGFALVDESLGTFAQGHLPGPGGSQSAAYGINDAGSVVGAYGPSVSNPYLMRGLTTGRAFVHEGDGASMEDLTDLIPADSGWTLHTAFDINNRGQIVGQGTHDGVLHGFLLTPIGDVNITAERIVVTQVVQNEENLDLLVANKQTYAVVRAHSDTRDVFDVEAELRGYRAGSLLGTVDPVGPPATVRQHPGTADAQYSFVFAIPPGWTDPGGLSLEATVNSDQSIPETRYSDNEVPATTVDLRPSPPVKILVVDTYFARNPVAVPNAQAFDLLRDRMRRLLPTSSLDIRHAPVPLRIAEPPVAPGAGSNCGPVLEELKVLRRTLDLDDDTLLYGLVPAESDGSRPYSSATTNGCSYVPSKVQTGWTGPEAEDTAVHEYVHALGRQHTPSCGAVGTNSPAYPSDPSGRGLISVGSLRRDMFTVAGDRDLGFDGSTLEFLPPGSTSDLMTYCRPRWMSDYTYENVYGLMMRPLRDPQPLPGRRADVTGTIDAVDGTADVAVREILPGSTASEPEPGPYHVEVYDGAAKLSDTPFTPSPLNAEQAGDERPTLGFAVTVPLPAEADRVAIFDDRAGREIGLMAVGGSAPTVSITSPAQGAVLPASGPLTVSWASGDGDGDPLAHTVLYRSSADAPWVPVSGDVTGTSTSVDASRLAGSDGGTIRVVADDGLHLGADEVGDLAAPDKAPVVAIAAPSDGKVVTVEQDVLLDGRADSPQGALPDSAYQWTSDRDGALGAGATVLAQSLSVGTHEIELRVSTPGGQEATATSTLVVREAGGTPSELAVSHHELAFAGTPSSPPAAQSFEVYDPAGGALDWTAESDDPRVTLSSNAGTTPATLDVIVDSGGMFGGDSFEAAVTVRRPGAPQVPLVVRIDAASSVAGATVTPSRADFGRRAIGAPGPSHTITFTNNASGALTLGAATLAGAVPGDYSIGADGCSSATLSTGGSCTVEVSFDPGAPGQRPAFAVFTDATGGASWYVSLTGHAAHSFASKLVAWGANDRGQLGVSGSPICTPTYACQSSPVEVPGITDVVQMATGPSHSLVLKSDGTVWAFGANNAGQLGQGTRSAGGPTPVQVQGIADVQAIAAAESYSLALKHDGTVWQWGVNPLNISTPLDLPAQVPGIGEVGVLTDVAAIAAGNPRNSGCGAPTTGYALRHDGTVVDWSSSLYGLGAGQSSTDCYAGWVVQVQRSGQAGQALTNVVSVAPGIAATSDGSVWTWGGNDYGEMGNGSIYSTYLNAWQVSNSTGTAPLSGISAVAADGSQRYALAGDGNAWAWGAGSTYGDAQRELGVGTAAVVRVTRPMHVQLPQAVTALQPGIAVAADGSAYGWGENSLGQAGVGTLSTVFPPTSVLGIGGSGTLDGVTAFAGGSNHHLALTGLGQGPPTTLSALAPVDLATHAGATVDEVVGSFDDSGASKAFDFSATVDWGDGSEPTGAVVTGPVGGPYEVRSSHLYQAPGSFGVTVDVVGLSGDSLTLTGSVSVGAATLTALAGSPVSSTAGAPARQPVGEFESSNPMSADSSFAATIDWGDGSPTADGAVTGPPGGPFSVVGEHAYRRAGTYAVVVQVSASDGATATIANQATVGSAPLVAGDTFGTDVAAGTAFSGPLASFHDGNPLSAAADYTALVDWGDGTSGAGTVGGPTGGPYTVSGSHTYATAQPFPVTVTLTGPAGAGATATTTLMSRRQRISVTATASPAAGPAPLTTTLAYEVRNDGTERMWAVTAQGSHCGSASYAGGDDGNGSLDPAEAWTFTCEHTFDTAGELTDVAWASAYPLGEGLLIRSDDAVTNVNAGGDATPPVVSVTGVLDGANYAAGSVPVAGCSAVDPEPGSGIAIEATPVTSGGPTEFTVTCSGAVDGAGNVGNTAVAHYTVTNTNVFSGFEQPVDDRPTVNKAKAGSAVPVKFSLGGDLGVSVFADGYPRSQQIPCGAATDLDGVEQTVAAGASSLSYDPGSDTYTYVWKTDPAWKGTCRQLVLTFADGTVGRADFSFPR